MDHVFLNVCITIGSIFCLVGGVFVSVTVSSWLLDQIYFKLRVGTAFMEFLIWRSRKQRKDELQRLLALEKMDQTLPKFDTVKE